MLSYGDLAGLWGERRVVRFDEDALREVAIPASAKRFLVRSGLPWRIMDFFAVEAGVDKSSNDAPRDRIREATVRSSAHGDALRIGWDYVSDICIIGTGEVWVVPRDDPVVNPTVVVEPATDLFVNSTVDRFVESLYLFSKARTAVDGFTEAAYEATLAQPGPLPVIMSDAELDASLADLGEQLRDVDPAALSSPESWWPGVLETCLTL